MILNKHFEKVNEVNQYSVRQQLLQKLTDGLFSGRRELS